MPYCIHHMHKPHSDRKSGSLEKYRNPVSLEWTDGSCVDLRNSRVIKLGLSYLLLLRVGLCTWLQDGCQHVRRTFLQKTWRKTFFLSLKYQEFDSDWVILRHLSACVQTQLWVLFSGQLSSDMDNALRVLWNCPSGHVKYTPKLMSLGFWTRSHLWMSVE